jgi:hypothetical protein
MTGEAVSPRFEVDNTPPRVEGLTAKLEGGKIHVMFRAVDSFSPVTHAEYSLDANDWEVVDPVGQISDSKTESYDFSVPLSAASGEAGSGPEEHTIVVRAYDRYENMGSGKVVVGR